MTETAPAIPDACRECGDRHPDPLARYRCRNCRRTVCRAGAHDGRRWNRRGELVHLIQYRPMGAPRAVVRICGALERVEDWESPDLAPGNLPDTRTPQPTEAQ